MPNEAICRLLLVEDSRGDAMVIQALVAEAGRRSGTRYQVDHVGSYAAAMNQLATTMEPYGLVLLDLGLPDSDGIGSVVDLTERYPALAVVVMTALEDPDAGIEAVASGAQDFLSKGKVHPDDLARVLRHAILRRRMEQTLRESEAEHRALFVLNPQPIWVCERRSLRVLAANDAAVRIYGWSADQFLAMQLTDLSPTEQLPQWFEYLQAGTGLYSDHLWRHRTRYGGELQVQLAMHALEFFGRPAVLVMAREVTDSARLASRLASSEQRYDALFDLAAGLIFEHSLDGVLGRANAEAAEALGLQPDSLVGQHLRQLVPPQAIAGTDRYLETLKIHAIFDGTLWLTTHDLKRRQYRVRSRCFSDAGQPTRVLMVADEIEAEAGPS